LLLLSVSGITTQAQQKVVENSENLIIMSEDDIISLAMKLRALKKDRLSKMTLMIPDSSKSKINTLEKNTFEVDYLRSQIVVLENQIKGYEISKNASKPKAITSVNTSNSLNQTELNNIKQDISQLKDLVRQLAIKTNNDLTVVVPITQLETEAKIVPTDTIVKEEIPTVNKENLVLKNKLDSLTVLFKNFKETDYSGDFTALEKRITALKKELALKNAPTSYDNLIKEYKGFSRSIYFENNSTDLNEEGTKVVAELNEILDKNDNIDIVVKGFASNKGVALYNENLSMMRTESVKKALILKGIQPIRVLTEYHGIDFKATADKARRVEISILVRK
jgi:outer membrane protein OmpA-like peptidoglycan-associated protein